MPLQTGDSISRQNKRHRQHLGSGLLLVGMVMVVFGVARHFIIGEVQETSLPISFLGSQQKDVKKIVKRHFPGAMKGAAVMSTALKVLKPYGLTRANTIYGQSICSDEINGDAGHLSTLLTRYYGGRTFPLGGIGGAPYVGKTGFLAFSHHVPSNGHVFIIFGPHIGYTPSGEPGKFQRMGQAKVSTSCGAVIAAYGQCMSGENFPADPQDMEQSWLREKLAPHCDKIAKSRNPMVQLTMKAYSVLEEEMLSIVNTDYGSGNLVLLGGIQINMPYPSPGFFVPLHFSVRSKEKGAVDLMPAFRR